MKNIRIVKSYEILIFYCFPTTNTRNRWVKTNTEIVGYLVESVIANALEKPLFWRTPQKDEVDFIVDKKLPIEVKYQSQITNDCVKSLLKFCKNFIQIKGSLSREICLKDARLTM